MVRLKENTGLVGVNYAIQKSRVVWILDPCMIYQQPYLQSYSGFLEPLLVLYGVNSCGINIVKDGIQ